MYCYIFPSKCTSTFRAIPADFAGICYEYASRVVLLLFITFWKNVLIHFFLSTHIWVRILLVYCRYVWVSISSGVEWYSSYLSHFGKMYCYIFSLVCTYEYASRLYIVDTYEYAFWVVWSGTPPIYHILEKCTATFSSYLSLRRNPVFGASTQRISRPSYTAVVALTAFCNFPWGGKTCCTFDCNN